MICHKSDKNSINIVAEALKSGKTVIIPTDTVYGFSAVSNIAGTDENIRKIKGRDEAKPFIQLIAKPDDIFLFSDDEIPEKVKKLWPGPLTLIVKDKRLEKSSVSTTAFRCPGDIWLREIITLCGNPVYSTSVNLSGHPVLDTEEDIVKIFGDKVDLIVLDGDKKNARPSTIVKVEDGKLVVLRQGDVEIL